jgi:ABC-type proline/glycine betaine transport system permease subunit
VTRRSRIAWFGVTGALVGAGLLCALLLDGTAAGVLSIVTIGAGIVVAVSLVFLEIGLSEDRERAERQRRREP